MESKNKHIIILLLALGVVFSASSQDTTSVNADEEPLDLELVRMPVRRPGYPVLTTVTVRGKEAIERYAKHKEAEEKQKAEAKKAVNERIAKQVAEANKRSQRKQTQEEIDANIEKYLAEARAKAPKRETYRPFPTAARRVHDEENMTKEQLLRAFDAKRRVGMVKYQPKSAPSVIEKNSIYLYFEVPTGGRPGPMCIRVQYYADDRLDTKAVEFQINGEKYLLTPKKLDTRKNGIFVSEWFDMTLDGDYESLVEAMGYANYVRVKFIGKSVNHIKDLTREQVADLRKAYFLRKRIQ